MPLYFSLTFIHEIMKKHVSLLMLLLAMMFCACSKKGDIASKIQYFAFQSEKDGRWGLISTDGKVLFADEFKNAPSAAMNDRFVVENSNGEYEIYTAEIKPKQVGDTYKAICPFVEKVTPAVQKGKNIVLVNTDGEVVKELDKLSGKKVLSVCSYEEGIAIFRTYDNRYGAIDTDGDVVIEPKFLKLGTAADGKILAVDEKDEAAYKSDDKDKLKYQVLSTDNGKTLGEIPANKIDYIGDAFSDDIIAGCENDDEENKRSGLVGTDGEWTLKPMEKFKSIYTIRNKHFVFKNEDGTGLATIDGEVVIRPKYASLDFAADDILMAYDDNKDSDERYFLLDLDGERIGKRAFHNIVTPFLGDGKYAVVAFEEDHYGFVDRDGEKLDLEDGTNIYNVNFSTGSYEITSDNIEYDDLVNILNVTKNGLYGFSFNMNPEDAAKMVAALKGERRVDPSDFTTTRDFECDIECGPLSLTLTVEYPDCVASSVDKPDGTTGYRFNKELRPSAIYVTYKGDEEEAKSKLLEALKKKTRSLGKTFANTEDVTASEVNSTLIAIARKDGSNILFGIGIGSPSDVNPYDTSTSEEAVADSAVADYADIDSVAAY